MGARGVWRLLGSCFPLVLSFMVAAVLAGPAAPGFSPSAPSRPLSVSSIVHSDVSAAQSASASADQPAAPAVTTPSAPRAAVVAASPRALQDTGVRALAAPRGPPRHFA